MPINERLQVLLDESGVEYEIIHHQDDFRAVTTAEDTHTPAREFAKAVFLWIDGSYAMATLPATHFVAESKLARSLGAENVRLAFESEMQDLCPDCEVGAAPPFGTLYGLPVYASPVLARDDHVTFNAGTHRDAVRMAYKDFERLVKPRILPLSRHEDEG
ncbi:MAG: YbaK/EbsC family protein [Myxococcota bacterium]